MADPKLRMIIPSDPNWSFLFSNLTEADYAVWATATVYAVGDRRIITNLPRPGVGVYHWIVECVQAHTSSSGADRPDHDIDAASGAGTYWVRVSYTNRWKAMDGIVNDRSINPSGAVTNWFTVISPATSVVFLNAKANTAEVRIYDGASDVIVQTQSLIETSGIVDWWSYFYLPTTYKSAAVFPQTPAYTGQVIKTSVSGLTQNELGEVLFGIDYEIGDASFPIDVAITDYSTKDRDPYGNPYITTRPYAKSRTFTCQILTQDSDRIDTLLSSVHTTPVIFYISDAPTGFSALIYGLFKDYQIKQDYVASNVTLQIEGMI